jgi:hypothetical protein
MMAVIKQYLNNNVKKKTINLFIPMLFGFKNNKMITTFYYENMYYKIFYLIFNHISLIDVFFKDKKIFYNFSKYFQFNLYVYLIKTNLIILNLFFHFFYMLFLTFENFEDIYYNNIIFKGYKQRYKYKPVKQGWIKPDYGITFYFNQRINSISLYVLNFNIYKNSYFYKYNLFLINTKLIYKLLHYFKMLQYKLQSFILLYRRHFRIEKRIRKIFAKTNLIIYKKLNNKLIEFFSVYKLYLQEYEQKKKKITFSLPINDKINKNLIFKPIFDNQMKLDFLAENKIQMIETFKLIYPNVYFNENLCEMFFGLNFSKKNFAFFSNILFKIDWMNEHFDDSFYRSFLTLFFYKFLKRNNLFLRGKFLNIDMIVKNFKDSLEKTIVDFFSEIFDLNQCNLDNLIKQKFLDYIMQLVKFDLVLNSINVYVKTFQQFYHNIIEICRHFLDYDFKNFYFYKDLDRFFRLMKNHFVLFPMDESHLPQTYAGKRIRRMLIKQIYKKKKNKIVFNFMRKRLTKYYLDLNINQDNIPYVLRRYLMSGRYILKKSVLQLRELTRIKYYKKKKNYLLSLLKRKYNNKKKKKTKLIRNKINKIIKNFIKKKNKSILNYKMKVGIKTDLFLNETTFLIKSFKLIKARIKKYNIKKNYGRFLQVYNVKSSIFSLSKILNNYILQFNHLINWDLYDQAIYIFEQIKFIESKLNTIKNSKNKKNNTGEIFKKIKKKKTKKYYFFRYVNSNFDKAKKKNRKEIFRKKHYKKTNLLNKLLKRFFRFYQSFMTNYRRRKYHNLTIRRRKSQFKRQFQVIVKFLFSKSKSKKRLLLRFLKKSVSPRSLQNRVLKRKGRIQLEHLIDFSRKIKGRLRKKVFNVKFFKNIQARNEFYNRFITFKKYSPLKFFKNGKRRKRRYVNQFFVKLKRLVFINFKTRIKKSKSYKLFKGKKKIDLIDQSDINFKSFKKKLIKLKKLNLFKIEKFLTTFNKKQLYIKKIYSNQINKLTQFVKVSTTLCLKLEQLVNFALKKNISLNLSNLINCINLKKFIQTIKKLKILVKLLSKNKKKKIISLNKFPFTFISLKKESFFKKPIYFKRKLYKNKFFTISKKKCRKKKFLNSKKFNRSYLGFKFKKYKHTKEYAKITNRTERYKRFLKNRMRALALGLPRRKFHVHPRVEKKAYSHFFSFYKMKKNILKFKKNIAKFHLNFIKNKNKLGFYKKSYKKSIKFLIADILKNNVFVNTQLNLLKILELEVINNNDLNLMSNLTKLFEINRTDYIKLINLLYTTYSKLEENEVINNNSKGKKELVIDKLKEKIENIKIKIKQKLKNKRKKRKLSKKKEYEKKQRNLKKKKMILKQKQQIIEKLNRKKNNVQKPKKIKKPSQKFLKMKAKYEKLEQIKRAEALKRAQRHMTPREKERDNQRRRTREVEFYYRQRYERRKRLKALNLHNRRRTKKQKMYQLKANQIIAKLKKKKKNHKNFTKYIFYFKILLKTRLKLFKNNENQLQVTNEQQPTFLKTNYRFLFLNKLKNSIKNILFKNKAYYYNLVKFPFSGLSFYNEYRVWFSHYKKLKKIPFKLIKLYSKFYFNKLLYNLKFKSNFMFFFNKFLKAKTQLTYFINKKGYRPVNKTKVRKLFQIMFYNVFQSHIKYFISSRKVIFSLLRNATRYISYKFHDTKRDIVMEPNTSLSFFFHNLKQKRSFCVSKYTHYSNFFFIYWATKFYGYKVYTNENNKFKFDDFHLFYHYFKFFKSKSFFFNYLINFIFAYIQKVNINILNYVFILNQYKTTLIIESTKFYKYLIFFFFKRTHYNNFFQLKEKDNLTNNISVYFSFFSVFFKQMSLELINWYSILNNSYSNAYQFNFLFNLCFIPLNTNAVYLHYKFKYLYYYRVYSFYIFYIFYYLYNHLFKVYKKLKLKSFKLSYDLIKYNEYNRYYLGLRTRMLILTIRNRYKRGFTIERIFRDLKFFLGESIKKKELAGYYISIRGRYKRSSRSNKLIIKRGVYSFNKIDLKVDSSYGTLNTKYGIAGIKVIFAFK